MTSSHHGLYIQGDTRATMAGTDGGKPVRGSKSEKAGLSSDHSLTQSAKLNVVTRDSNISFYDHLAYLIKPNNR